MAQGNDKRPPQSLPGPSDIGFDIRYAKDKAAAIAAGENPPNTDDAALLILGRLSDLIPPEERLEFLRFVGRLTEMNPHTERRLIV